MKRAVPKRDRGVYDLAHVLMLDRKIRSWQLVLNGTRDRPAGWYLTLGVSGEYGPMNRAEMEARLRQYVPNPDTLAKVCVVPLTSTLDVDRVLALVA